MFIVTSSGELKYQDKLVMKRGEDNVWSIGCMDKTLPHRVAQIVFDYWFHYELKGNGLFMLSDLKLILDDKRRILGDYFFPINSQERVEIPHRYAIDISAGVNKYIFMLDSILPELEIGRLGYDIGSRSIKVYDADGIYKGRIPLY